MKNIDLSDYMTQDLDGTPAIYVGTYGKYNGGSIFGAWLDLTTFADYEEFLQVCAALHEDEKEPEFMAQDFSGFPESLYTEGFLSEREFNLIQEYAKLDEDKKEAFEVFDGAFGNTQEDVEIFDEFNDQYIGQWRSEEDFAEDLVIELGILDEVPEDLKNYFDYKAYARDLFIDDYYFESGYVFRRY